MDDGTVKRLGAALVEPQDARLAVSLLERMIRLVRTPGEPVQWGVETAHPDMYTLRVSVDRRPGGALLTWMQLRELYDVSPCVLGMRLAVDRALFIVTIRRCHTVATAAPLYTAPPQPTAWQRRRECARRRIDWTAAGVREPGDADKLANLYALVHNMETCMPLLLCWLEPINAAGRTFRAAAAAAAAAAGPPAAGSGDEEESATECGGGDSAIGYALAFAGVPEVQSCFISALYDAHPASVAHAYVWYSPPAHIVSAAASLLVVVLRREVAVASPLLRAHRVRGIGRRRSAAATPLGKRARD